MAFTPPPVDSVIDEPQARFTPPPLESEESDSTPSLGSLKAYGARDLLERQKSAQYTDGTDFLQALTQAPADIGSGFDSLSKGAGKVISTVGNIPANVYNAGAALTHVYPPKELPFQEGQSVLPESIRSIPREFVQSLISPENEPPAPPARQALSQGLQRTADKLTTGFTTPEGLASLPLLEAPAGRALMLGVQAVQTPAMLEKTYDVLQDPDSTKADKWEVLGDAGANLAMSAALALHLKPSEIKAKLNPEQVASVAPAPIEETPNAVNPQVNESSLEAEHSGTDTSRSSAVSGPSHQLLNPAESQPQGGNAPNVKVADEATSLAAMPIADFTKEIRSRKGGLTPDAYRLGQSVETPEDLQAIQDARDSAKQEAEAAKKAGDLNTAIAAATRGQYFREAYEAATGTGSAGKALRRDNPEFKAAIEPAADNTGVYLADASTDFLPPETKPEIVDQPVNNSEPQPEGDPTSIKNSVVDQERATRGLPPAETVLLARDFPTVLADAAQRDGLPAADPKSTDSLVAELDKKPRALTDTEDAMLLRRQVTLQNEFDKVNNALVESGNKGESNPEAQIRRAILSDSLQQLYDVGKRSGTETGRGLNARKMLLNEDYSLAKMEVNKRAAVGGRPLTVPEQAELQAAHDKIAATQKALDEHIAATKDSVSKAEVDRLINEAKGKSSNIHPSILDAAKRIVDTLDKRADSARARLKERLARTSAGIDPTILKDLAEVGASHLAHAALDFTEWSAKMVGEFGDIIKPHLDELYKSAQNKIKSITSENPLELARAMREKSPEEQIKANSEKIGEKIAAGKKGDATWYIQRIARLLVESGVKDRETLIDRVHDVLKEHLPDITRRETMDAISGYGDFKQLTKDKVSLELRGMKGEMQQLAKLEDMAAGESPKKSGVERRSPTEAERQLIKKVNEAKFAFQVPMTDPATQLKSALDTYKTTLKNRISDFEDKIRRQDYTKQPRRELLLDQKAVELRAAAERAKNEFQRGLIKDRLDKRGPVAKALDALAKWKRAAVLTYPTTIAKLASAAAEGIAVAPAEELAGEAIHRLPIINRISEKAPRQGGGINLAAESKAISDTLVNLVKNFKTGVKTGSTDFSAVYDKPNLLPPELKDYIGKTHFALKTPLLQNEYSRSLVKLIDHAAKNGIDISDPMVQMRFMEQARQKANENAKAAIFSEDNMVVDAYRRAMTRFSTPEPGKTDTTGFQKAAKFGLNFELPIVKIPSNILKRTFEYSFGIPVGGTRILMHAIGKGGIDGMSEADAELVMRNLKRGSLGGTVALIGFLNPNSIGGYYQPGEKRKPSDVLVGGIKIGSVNIPRWLIHNPLLEQLQIGATIRRVADSKLGRTSATKGIPTGIMAAYMGLTREVPWERGMEDAVRALDPREAQKFLGEAAKSTIPGVVQWIAANFDKDANGNYIRRAPKTAAQVVETGIPGLRQTVPVKK